jgi:hypothetical protein
MSEIMEGRVGDFKKSAFRLYWLQGVTNMAYCFSFKNWIEQWNINKINYFDTLISFILIKQSKGGQMFLNTFQILKVYKIKKWKIMQYGAWRGTYLLMNGARR